jgi:TPR repeat protein
MTRKPTPATPAASLIRAVLLTPALWLLIPPGHLHATDTPPRTSQPNGAASAQIDLAAPAASRDVAQLEEKARQKDPDALNKLGLAYLEGGDVSQDDVKAAEYFRKAADLGYWKGQLNLGLMYARGRGLAKDPGEALQWIQRAADQGVSEAQLDLAVLLDQGKEVPKNFKEAITWYEKAATGGSAPAAAELGRIYLAVNDEGIPRDFAAAAKWFRQAAEAGDPKAQNSLGIMLQFGYGVEKNLDEAVKWYERAVDQGDAKGQLNMGRLYCFADGLYRDNIAAYKWFSLSAGQGDGIAQNILREFKNALNPEERAEAEYQIKLYKEAHPAANPPAEKANPPAVASPQK